MAIGLIQSIIINNNIISSLCQYCKNKIRSKDMWYNIIETKMGGGCYV